MNELQVFQNEEFGTIRTMIIDNKPWFIGKDICANFGDTNHNRTLSRVDDADKKVVEITDSLGRVQSALAVNESGLYSVLFSMQPKKAHRDGVSDEYPIITAQRIEKIRKFKHWVTSEVLPSIRKHGVYMTDDVIMRTLTDPDYLIRLANVIKEERRLRVQAEQQLEEQKPLVDFAEKVSDSTNLITVGEMAKLLNDDHIPIGRNRLFRWLRGNGILMDNNVPYQRYVDDGYFQVKESVFESKTGPKVNLITKITGKGQQFIAERLRKEYDTHYPSTLSA